MLGIRKTLVQVAIGALVLAGSAFATTVCSNVNDVQLGGTGYPGNANDYMAYCLDSYGTVDGWYNLQNTGSTVNFMGESAMYISYSYNNGGPVGTNSTWLAPAAGAPAGAGGNTNFSDSALGASAVALCSGSCGSPAALQVAPQAESTIVDTTDGITITIDSAVIGQRLKQVLTITNTSANSITGWSIGTYFQYFPYGVGNNNSGGTLSFASNDVHTIENTWVDGLAANFSTGTAEGGQQCGGFDSGAPHSCANPDSGKYALEANGVDAANDIVNGTYTNHASVGYGAGSGTPGGAMLFSTPSSSNNQTFILELVPEPTTSLLLGGGLLGLAALLRRRKK